MTMKIGVDVAEINYRLYAILPTVKHCVRAYGGGNSIITSMSEEEKERFGGKHNVLIVEITKPDSVSLVYRRLKKELVPNYDIVEDNGIISIKWDPEQRGLF
ncbi:hypothetical protein ES703_80718 [subsurface metagenome]